MFHLYYGQGPTPRETGENLDELIDLAESERSIWYESKYGGCCITDEHGFVRWAPGDHLVEDFYRGKGISKPVCRRDIWGRWWEWGLGCKMPVFPSDPEAERWIALATKANESV